MAESRRPSPRSMITQEYVDTSNGSCEPRTIPGDPLPVATLRAMPRSLEGLRITVMGLGRFGGGVGVTRWLAGQGATVLVTDKEPAERLAESVGQIQDLVSRGDVTMRLGEHNVSDFTTADLVV